MKQITEDYCSFEIAQLLKEKGFKNEYCDNMLLAEDGDTIWKFATFTNRDDAFDATMKFKKQIPYVTHQMALKWLREVHNIVIVIEPYDSWEDARFEFTIYKRHDNDTFEWDMIDVLNSLHKGYETCIDAAVKYTLENLI